LAELGQNWPAEQSLSSPELAFSIILYKTFYQTYSLLSVLLLDPSSNVSAPGNRAKQRAQHILRVNSLSIQDVEDVALMHAVSTGSKHGKRNGAKNTAGKVGKERAQNLGRRSLAFPGHVLSHLQRGNRLGHSGLEPRGSLEGGSHADEAEHEESKALHCYVQVICEIGRIASNKRYISCP